MKFMNKITSPKISIIMINYNWLSYLKRTIKSVINLIYDNKEFIIVDNWSNDWSLEFIMTFNEIKLIKSPRLREKNYACNLWVRNSTWEFLLIIDNDIIFENVNLLKDLITEFLNKKNIWCLWLSYVNEWENKTSAYWNFLSYYYSTEKKSIKIDEVKKYNWIKIWFPSWALIFIKKETWEEIWWYDEYLKFWWDDSDLWIKLWINWYNNYLYSNSTQIHIWIPERNNNKKFTIKFKEMFFADMYTIVKNFNTKNMIITIIIYSFYYFLRSIKQSLFRLNIWPFISFFKWYYLFLISLPIALEKRKKIQKNRIIKNDIFLKIKQ